MKANLYLHTHWDREWYLPYESYRMQLVCVVREVLEKLASGELPNFLLDGQSCAIEDVLQIAPELAGPIRELMKEGKLQAGPWYVLADQMLVAGESLVRNLKIGLDTTRQFGEPAMIGYCPDTFGHTADMPRILRGFGIDSAFVWRGVPEIKGQPVFRWVSPDGSWVLTHFLALGYYHAAFHFAKPTSELVSHLFRFVAGQPKYPVLVPVGGDHLAPAPDFGKQLAAVRTEIAAAASSRDPRSGRSPASQTISRPISLDTLDLSTEPITVFAESWRPIIDKGARDLFAVEGELRDNACALEHERGYMLPGVLSARLYLKRENRIAEHRLIRKTEPLYTILSRLTGMTYPHSELLYAWKLMLKNHPHDSICGCSIDEVHREMLQRWHKFHHALNALDARCVEWTCSRGGAPVPHVSIGPTRVTTPSYSFDRIAVFNLSSETVNAPVLVTWAEEPGDQKQSRSSKADSPDVQIITKDREPLIFAGTGREPEVLTVDVNRAWIWAQNVPPMGVRSTPFLPAGGGTKSDTAIPYVKVESRKIDNGLLAVEIDPVGDLIATAHTESGDVTYRLRHFFRDIGDGGDEYNFDPLFEDTPITAKLVSVSPWLRGKLVASLQVTYDVEIPATITDNGDGPVSDLRSLSRSKHTTSHTITTEISLRRGVPIVFFDTRWLNRSTDHRLEVVFDTSDRVDESWSENHFSVVARTHKKSRAVLPVETGTEAPLNRFPCQRFFIANDQLFLNKGLPEYGVEGSEVSLTVLRAVSRLSRRRLRTRGGGAGPAVGTPDANCMGMNEVSYGWAPLSEADAKSQLPEAYRLAELFEGVLYPVPINGAAMPEEISLFSLDNHAVRCVAMYDTAQGTFIRLLNVSHDPQSVRLSVQLSTPNVYIANMDEKLGEQLSPVRAVDGTSVYSIEFGSNQLLTLFLA